MIANQPLLGEVSEPLLELIRDDSHGYWAQYRLN